MRLQSVLRWVCAIACILVVLSALNGIATANESPETLGEFRSPPEFSELTVVSGAQSSCGGDAESTVVDFGQNFIACYSSSIEFTARRSGPGRSGTSEASVELALSIFVGGNSLRCQFRGEQPTYEVAQDGSEVHVTAELNNSDTGCAGTTLDLDLTWTADSKPTRGRVDGGHVLRVPMTQSDGSVVVTEGATFPVLTPPKALYERLTLKDD